MSDVSLLLRKVVYHQEHTHHQECALLPSGPHLLEAFSSALDLLVYDGAGWSISHITAPSTSCFGGDPGVSALCRGGHRWSICVGEV